MATMSTTTEPMTEVEIANVRTMLRSGPPPHFTDGVVARLLATLDAERLAHKVVEQSQRDRYALRADSPVEAWLSGRAPMPPLSDACDGCPHPKHDGSCAYPAYPAATYLCNCDADIRGNGADDPAPVMTLEQAARELIGYSRAYPYPSARHFELLDALDKALAATSPEEG